MTAASVHTDTNSDAMGHASQSSKKNTTTLINGSGNSEPSHDDENALFCEHTLERAEKLYSKGDRAQARALFESIISHPLEADAGSEVRAKEQAICRLGELLLLSQDGTALMQLLQDVRPFFELLPKAKTTRLVRRLFDMIVQSGVALDIQHTLCLSLIKWAREEKRTFLRHRLQLRLVEVLFEMKDRRAALATLHTLLREVRRLDDRTLLLDIYLLESKIYYSIRNSSKARAALVAARTTANSIYCPPFAQAELDLQSGILHAEEHDVKTAYSYLFEAFEGFHQLGDQAKLARRALRYMILTKIATDSPDELAAVLSSKNVLAYRGADMDALRAIATAYNTQDTHMFNNVLSQLREQQQHQQQQSSRQPDRSANVQQTHTDNEEDDGTATASVVDQRQSTNSATDLSTYDNKSMIDSTDRVDADTSDLLSDEVVRRELEEMYDTLMERHLLKIIEPYNRVQLAHLASLLRVDEATVEARVSQLILDGKLRGIVDQQHSCLVVFDEVEQSRTRKAVVAAAAASPDGGLSYMGNTNSNTNNASKDTIAPYAVSSGNSEGNKMFDDFSAEAHQNARTTLHTDALTALESFDSLVTALFDKVAGKFDALVEEQLAKRKTVLKSNEREGGGGKEKESKQQSKTAAGNGSSSSSPAGSPGSGAGASGTQKDSKDSEKSGSQPGSPRQGGNNTNSNANNDNIREDGNDRSSRCHATSLDP